MNFGPNIVTDGLVFAVDAANPSSYVSGSSGTLWSDLKKTNNVTLLNGPVFDTSNQGCINFDGVNDNAQIEGNPGVSQNLFNGTANSVCAWVNNDQITKDATIVGNWSTQYILYMDTGGAGDGYRVLLVEELKLLVQIM